MQRHANRQSEDGLTLVEVLVSLAVPAFIALSLMSMLSTSMHLDKLAQERSIATSLASERVMLFNSQRYQVAEDYANYRLTEETAVAADADAGTPATFTSDYGEVPDYPNFKRVVELYYDVPKAGMLKIETTVSWTHLTQGERGHTMIAFLHHALE